MTGAYLPSDGGLDDRVPFLSRLASADRSVLLALGRELSVSPRIELLHQHEPSSLVLFIVHG
ncbi:hypothetical protein [Streptomyces sp. NPDC056949]|uniref:hypothetical protein n=1 Tax=Streptomyces sp. NPDC056949 TaxID=3345976 RepID=UPI003637DE26